MKNIVVDLRHPDGDLSNPTEIRVLSVAETMAVAGGTAVVTPSDLGVVPQAGHAIEYDRIYRK